MIIKNFPYNFKLNNHKMMLAFIAIFAAIFFSVLFIPLKQAVSCLTYELNSKNGLKINLSLLNQGISTVSADPSNRLFLRAEVRDGSGNTVEMAHIKFYVSSGEGEIYTNSNRTDKFGECLASYIPPVSPPIEAGDVSSKVVIKAELYGTSISSSIEINLIRTPVVYIHGYQASGAVFDNMEEFLNSRGFESTAFTYKSENGVAEGAAELNSFLLSLKADYQSRGIQVGKFDVIAHSMGGLVARYYTGSSSYIYNNNIRKMIFISVPHHGSHVASLGMSYFNDKAISDLVPDNELFTYIYPSMINKGLNSTVQVGNIIGQYDEVVSLESVSLAEWNIKTEIFNVGDSNFSVNNLLNGSILKSQNHKTVLNNKKVFERIEEMLINNLPYPSKR